MSDDDALEEEEQQDFFHVTSLSGTSCTFPLSSIRHLRARIGCYMDTCSTHIILLDEQGVIVQDEKDPFVYNVEEVQSQYTVRPVHLRFIMQETDDFTYVDEAAIRVVDHLEVKDYRILDWLEKNCAHPIKRIKQEAWFIASQCGSRAVLEYLLSHIDNINIGCIDGCHALLLASDNGMEDNVQWLVQSTADIKNTRNLWGFSRLQNDGPIRRCYPNVVSILLAANAPVNTANRNGETPLHMAVSDEAPHNLTIVDSLLNAHADVNASSKNGQTPFHTLATCYEPNDRPILERLLQAQADVNRPSCNITILMLMLMQLRAQNVRDYPAIDLLLKANADIYAQRDSASLHQKDCDGPSALSLAIEWKDDELKDHLLKGHSEYKKIR